MARAVQGRSGLRTALFLFLAPLVLYSQSETLALKSARVKELMSSGRFAEAVPLCQELVQALPSNPGLRLNLGLALQMSGRLREAIPQFERVLAADPNSLPASLSLGAARLELNEPLKAIPALERAVKLDPSNVNARGLLAGALLSQGRAKEAAVHYRKLTSLTPGDPKAWHGLGQAYEALAEQAFNELTKTSEGSAEWLSLVAESRIARRQFRSAFFFFKQALSKNPDFLPARMGIAVVYRATDHPDWAAAEERKLKSSPAFDCARQKAACDFQAGRYLQAAASPSPYWRARASNQLALEAYSKLGTLPESLELHAIKAEIASNNGRHLEAAGEWRAALKLSPYDVTIQQSLAAELHDAGDYQAALEVLSRLNPEASAGVAFLTGDSLLRSEHPDQAIPLLDIALKLDPKLLPAHASMGLALTRTGKQAEAVPHLEAALPIDDDGSLHYQLARAYQASGDAAKSRETMAKYQAIQQKNEAEKRDLEEKAQITQP
jgi:tetratricopeptide (TPR) repeat protein